MKHPRATGCIFLLATVLLSVWTLTACGRISAGSVQDRVMVELGISGDLLRSGYAAADILAGRFQHPLPPEAPVLVASFADIDQMEESSTLGRALGEIFASRLSQQGFTVREIRLRKSVLVREGAGEFLLSRNAAQISREQQAKAVVTGTYAVGRYTVYVSTRIIRPEDNTVLAAHDWTLPRDADIVRMLGDSIVRGL